MQVAAFLHRQVLIRPLSLARSYSHPSRHCPYWLLQLQRSAEDENRSRWWRCKMMHVQCALEGYCFSLSRWNHVERVRKSKAQKTMTPGALPWLSIKFISFNAIHNSGAPPCGIAKHYNLIMLIVRWLLRCGSLAVRFVVVGAPYRSVSFALASRVLHGSGSFCMHLTRCIHKERTNDRPNERNLWLYVRWSYFHFFLTSRSNNDLVCLKSGICMTLICNKFYEIELMITIMRHTVTVFNKPAILM